MDISATGHLVAFSYVDALGAMYLRGVGTRVINTHMPQNLRRFIAAIEYIVSRAMAVIKEDAQTS